MSQTNVKTNNLNTVTVLYLIIAMYYTSFSTEKKGPPPMSRESTSIKSLETARARLRAERKKELK